MKKIIIEEKKNGQVIRTEIIDNISIKVMNEVKVYVALQNEYNSLVGNGIVVDFKITNNNTEINLMSLNLKLVDKINHVKKIMNNGIKMTNRKYNRKENEGLLKMTTLNDVVKKVLLNKQCD